MRIMIKKINPKNAYIISEKETRTNSGLYLLISFLYLSCGKIIKEKAIIITIEKTPLIIKLKPLIWWVLCIKPLLIKPSFKSNINLSKLAHSIYFPFTKNDVFNTLNIVKFYSLYCMLVVVFSSIISLS